MKKQKSDLANINSSSSQLRPFKSELKALSVDDTTTLVLSALGPNSRFNDPSREGIEKLTKELNIIIYFVNAVYSSQSTTSKVSKKYFEKYRPSDAVRLAKQFRVMLFERLEAMMFSSIELVEFSLDSVTKAEFVRSESPIIDGMEEDNDINYPTLKEHYPEKSELVDSMEEHFDIVKKDFQIIQRLIDAIDDSINSLEREVETYHDIVNGEYHAMWIGECFIRALKEQNARVGISEGGPVEKFVANALKQIFDIDVSHQAMVQRLKRHVKHRGKL